jgi:FG-GAP-like repeat
MKTVVVSMFSVLALATSIRLAAAWPPASGKEKSEDGLPAGPGRQAVLYIPMATIDTGHRTVSVIASDLNQDKILDIIATNQGDGTVSVALGKRGGRFGPAVHYPTGTKGPYETVAVDLDGDGDPDLVSGNFGAANGEPYGRTVSVFLNEGDGTFAECVDYPATDAARDKVRAVAVGDLNGDGKADVVAASQFTGLQVLAGKGDGTLGRNTLHRAGGGVHGVIVADFNKDGKADVALANNGPRGGVTVLLGKGDGRFEAAAAYAAGAGTYGLAAGDVNGDGFPDLATADNRANTVSVLLGAGRGGPGTFAKAVAYGTSGPPTAVSMGDLDGDGTLDVVVATNSGGVIDTFRSTGDGTLQARVPVDTGKGCYGALVADLDSDGIADLAVARTDGKVLILKGKVDR